MTHEEARSFVKEHIKRRGDQSVELTEQKVRYWWHMLNVAVFYSRLHKPADVEVSRTRGVYAWTKTDSRFPNVTLVIQPKFSSRRLLLTVLIHEMVHAWEHQHHTRMGHGKRFYAWKNRIKRTVGFELDESIDENKYLSR